VARMILGGMGAGVLPLHLVTKLQKEGQKLHRFRGNGVPVKNAIGLAYLKEREPSSAGSALLSFIQAGLRDRQDPRK